MAWPSEVNGGEKTTSLLGNLLCVWFLIARMLARFLLGVAFSFAVASIWWLFNCVCMICGWGSLGFFGLGSLVTGWWRICLDALKKFFVKVGSSVVGLAELM